MRSACWLGRVAQAQRRRRDDLGRSRHSVRVVGPPSRPGPVGREKAVHLAQAPGLGRRSELARLCRGQDTAGLLTNRLEGGPEGIGPEPKIGVKRSRSIPLTVKRVVPRIVRSHCDVELLPSPSGPHVTCRQRAGIRPLMRWPKRGSSRRLRQKRPSGPARARRGSASPPCRGPSSRPSRAQRSKRPRTSRPLARNSLPGDRVGIAVHETDATAKEPVERGLRQSESPATQRAPEP